MTAESRLETLFPWLRVRGAPRVDALALAGIVLVGIAARAALFFHPHSGMGRPPMFGDFEAQRHWMEVTVALPPGEWYRQTPLNDLQYWGLDYPPLTAYVSYAFGKAAQWVVPDLVAFSSSRGHESAEGKLFMRLSVLVCDALVFIPAVLLAARVLAAVAVRGRGSNSDSAAGHHTPGLSLLALALLLLLQPAALVIDHGHFQYNNVSLGLVLAAATALIAAVGAARGVDVGLLAWLPQPLRRMASRAPMLLGVLAAAALFALALNFKQMTLYFAPVFFVALLAMCWARGLPGLLRLPAAAPHAQPAATARPTLFSRAAAVAAVGAPVIVVFALLWAPFCLDTTAFNASSQEMAFDGTGDKMPAAAVAGTCLDGLRAVLGRMFPFDRSLFEDKVSNLWCALDPVLRFRNRIYEEQEQARAAAAAAATAAEGGGAPVAAGMGVRRQVTMICTVTTVLLMLPSLVLLWRHTTGAMTASSNADEAIVVSGANDTKGDDAAASGCASAGQDDAPATADADVVASPAVTSAANSGLRKRRGSHATGGAVGDGSPVRQAVAPAADAGADSCRAPAAPTSASPLDRFVHSLLLALMNVALAFFLASYQVHEKTILLPLLPAVLLAPRYPLLATWSSLFGTWTMWPLLQKDGLLAPAALLCVIYAAMAWPSVDATAAADGAALARVVRRLSQLAGARSSSVGGASACGGGGAAASSSRRFAIALQVAAAASLLVGVDIVVAAHVVPPPRALPDLFAYASAVLGAAQLTALLVIGTLLQAFA